VFGKNNFYNRWASHKNKTNKGYKSALYDALRHFGWDSVKKEVLVITDDDNYSKLLEKQLIDVFKTNKCRHGDESNGYNLTDGGDGNAGWCPPKQWRDKISKANKGLKRNFSEEHKKHISESRIGLKISEETKRKHSINNYGEGNPFYGKKHSEYSINKMRNSKCRYTYTLQNTNEDIVITNNLCEFSRNFKVNRCMIIQGKTSNGWKIINKVDITTANNNKEENK
jgi:group I intron endonuclease